MQVEHVLDFGVAPELVWPWISEPAKLAQWIRDAQRFEACPPGALAAGSTLVAYPARGAPIEGRVERCTSARELVLLVRGLPNEMEVRILFELSASSGGTHLVLRAQTELTGLMIFAESMIASKARAKLEAWSAALRTLVAAG